MRRSHRLLVILSFFAALAAPAVAHAQVSERPATQLFMAPTGRTLPKGQGYFKALGVGIPSVQGGITDRFSMGIAVPVFGLGQIVALTPKFQILRSEKHATSVGAISVLTTHGSGTVGYVAHTIERESGAIHVTAMVPVVRKTSLRATLLMIGGEYRVNDRVLFMTENYVVPSVGAVPMVSGGVRVRTRYITWDLGLLMPTSFVFETRPMPMINAGWKF